MEQRDTRSLQQIKLETEQTRASLTQTVEQLRATVAERINPDAIKGEVSQYVRSRGEQLLDDATAAVRRNPMQAVAVGASVAYPLLRLARAIPVPIWLVGAGLFLASSKTGQSVSQKAADAASDLSNSLMYRARDIRDQAAGAADSAKSFASEKINRLTDAVTGGTNQLNSGAGTEGGFVSEQFQDGASGAASSYRTAEMGEQDTQGSGIRDMAADAASAGRRAVEASKNMGLHAARTVQETASTVRERAGKTLFETVEQNPLLVAGVGLFVGGLIASALPRSDMENRVVGKASNSVKRRADEAAAGAVRAAKEAVGGAFEEATKQAEAEGLTPEGVAQTARDLGERLRHVAEAAVTTAFEPAQNGNEHQQRNTHGETDHG
ncbi:MAG: DUF3618 domain-containing protein [Alphaproteobacteria bacterium]|nr:MAG: DUF3618 domain-containing protein [Alphaproteobacteria bacterium]